jgi:phosphoribosylanthranilate isomerase
MTGPRRTRVKICGIRSVEAAEVAIAAGADAIGVVFAEDSPRAVPIGAAVEVVRAATPFVTVVGVFRLVAGRDEPALDAWTNVGSWCQLHGDVDERVVSTLGRTHGVIRGFRFDADELSRWSRCPALSGLLVDGSAGGAGTSFDHAALAAVAHETDLPLILAGGLDAENVGDAIRTARPYAVDVSSGVESAPGVKDPALIEAFCAAVREADARG